MTFYWLLRLALGHTTQSAEQWRKLSQSAQSQRRPHGRDVITTSLC